MEKSFPEILRSMAYSISSGISPQKTVKNISKTQFGYVKKELEKIYYHMLLGLSFQNALKKFADGLDSKVIKQGVLILTEALKSGGKIEKILNTIADSFEILLKLREERRSKLKVYIVIIYSVFLLFMGVLVVLTNTLIPTLSEKGPEMQKLTGVSAPILSKQDYRNLFLNLCIIQGFFSGIIIGMMVYSNAVKGLKHSLILVFLSVLAFDFLVPIENPTDIIKKRIEDGDYSKFLITINKEIKSEDFNYDKKVMFVADNDCKVCKTSVMINFHSIKPIGTVNLFAYIEETKDKYIIHLTDNPLEKRRKK